MRSERSAPLVVLPGVLCDSRVFARQVDAFDAVTVIDGFGGFDSLAAMADHALAHAPDRMSLLGHSMGARVALEMLRRAPERIERLALVSTGTHLPRPREAEQRHALLTLGRERGIAALVDAWLPPMVATHNRAAILPGLRPMCIAMGVDAFAAQITALLARPEIDSLLPTIRVPVLVATGDHDVWSPPEQHHAIAAAIPHAQLRIVTGSGHMLPAERPDALNAAIADWLAVPVAHSEHTCLGETR